MGYTNFDITTSVQDALESVDGVELLEVMSRYRFFLGVGKLFNFSDVRRDVEEQLCDNFELDSDTEETVEMIKSLYLQIDSGLSLSLEMVKFYTQAPMK